MVEFTNTDSHHNTVMVKFMNASVAFVAVAHSYPLVQPTYLA